MAVDAIEQFQITKLFNIGHIGGQEIAFTNSSAYMFGSVAVIALLMIAGTSAKRLVAFLQAYVFAILACIYLNEAIHPGH